MAAVSRATSAGQFGRCNPCVAMAPRHQAGVTIVELILVIIILALLSAVAGPRFFNNKDFGERGYAEELASALRYAQKVAVGSGCLVRVQISTTSYALSQQAPQAGHCDPADATFPVTVMLSSGQAAAGTAPQGVTSAPAGAIIFDAEGSTSLAADAALTIGPHTLTVQADSGLTRGPG